MAVPSFEGVLRGANVESLYFWVCEDVNHILGFAIEDFCDVVVCLDEGLYPWEVSQVCEKIVLCEEVGSVVHKRVDFRPVFSVAPCHGFHLYGQIVVVCSDLCVLSG